jgi:hypothetical protein
VSGKKVIFQTLPDEHLHAFLQQVAGDRAAESLVELYKGVRDVGCESALFPTDKVKTLATDILSGYCVDYGGAALEASNAHLPQPARTFQEALEAWMDLVEKVFGGAN